MKIQLHQILTVDANDTIDNVKDAIQEATRNEVLPDGIPASLQVLTNAGGKKLGEWGEDERTLSDYKVTGRWVLKVGWNQESLEDWIGVVEQEGAE